MIIKLGDPPIRGMLHHAYPLSVLSTHKDFEHWFYTKYIQVVWQNRVIGKNLLEVLIFDFYLKNAKQADSPLLDKRVIPMADLASMEEPLTFVVDMLKQGYAIYLYADDYYIPGRFAYRKMHFVHDLLVYGFEESEETFHIAGYNERMLYTKGTVSSQALREAIKHAQTEEGLTHHPQVELVSVCTLLRINPEANCSFQLNEIRKEIADYLTETHVTETHTIGRQGSSKFGEYLEAAGDRRTIFDVRPFYLMWEHKKHLRNVLAYVEKQTGFSNEWSGRFAEIEAAMQKNRNLALKYSISRQSRLLEEMRYHFDQAQEKETGILEDFLNRFQ